MRAGRAVWEARVADWKASGLSSEAFCKGKDFSAGGLRHWSYRLRRAERDKALPENSSGRVVRVARVVRAPAANSEPDELPPEVNRPRAGDSQALVVEIGAARIAVRPGFDQPTLAAVLETLTAVARSPR